MTLVPIKPDVENVALQIEIITALKVNAIGSALFAAAIGIGVQRRVTIRMQAGDPENALKVAVASDNATLNT